MSGRRILQAIADGETTPDRLAELGDERLQCSQEELSDALTGSVEPVHRELLKLYLARLTLLDQQISKLDQLMATALKPHQDAVIRVAETPGFGVHSAQQIIAEVGVDAGAFPSAADFASWVGVCPGSDESAEKNKSPRSAKGNRYVRRLLIGIGAVVAHRPLPHHRAYGSVHGGSRSYAVTRQRTLEDQAIGSKH